MYAWQEEDKERQAEVDRRLREVRQRLVFGPVRGWYEAGDRWQGEVLDLDQAVEYGKAMGN